MNFLVIDGNSLVNRAFYGIKLLTAKDGHFTNALFGFMNMLLSLTEQTSPEAVAVAFDLKAPTFRHKLYGDYKAGRKPMPPELYEQMEPLKELLTAYGCHIVTCEGYEADDILGTLAAHTPQTDTCYIATGDRDALQLIRPNVNVLLITTKMGQTQTVRYDEQKLMEEYGLTPREMIELKALQGDNSDKIPGVPGVGPKTAGELIRAYHTIDALYEALPQADVTNGVRAKLEAGKDSAYLSRTLGEICLTAPIPSDIGSYIKKPVDAPALTAALARHEMFKLIARLKLDAPAAAAPAKAAVEDFTVPVLPGESLDLTGVNRLFIETDAKGRRCVSAGGKLYFFAEPGLTALAPALADENISLIVTDAKRLFAEAAEADLAVPNVAFDIRLAAYILNPNGANVTVNDLALGLHIPVPSLTCAEEPDGDALTALSAAAVLEPLYNRMQAQLAENEQTALLTDMELPLARVLAEMEQSGMAVNSEQIKSYAVVLADRITELENEIYTLAGQQFNINSPKQLGVVLFEDLKLPGKKKTKTGYSTNADVLEGLAADYPIVEKILEYRAYAKLKSTYCDGLLKAVAADGRIHSTFNQTETRTGRLSSTEPNLQNIPVRTAPGREFRKFFTAGPGNVLVDADYSQIELRVLAALANDPAMIAAFNSGVDIHTVTAAKVFGVPEASVTPELRSKAKAVNFGIVYGIGAFSLAKDIHSTRAEAEQFINAYLTLYSSIDKYMKNAIVTAREKGYAETLFHRRRYLPELTASNGMLRAFGERVARNMPIQGTAADIIKIAMVRVSDRLKRELPQGKLIMQVHDELILEVPESLADKAGALLKEEMEQAVSLSVKLSVDVGVGKTWYEAKT